MLADIGLVLSWILLVAQSQFVIGERIAFHSNLWTTELQRINPTVLPDLIVGMVCVQPTLISPFLTLRWII